MHQYSPSLEGYDTAETYNITDGFQANPRHWRNDQPSNNATQFENKYSLNGRQSRIYAQALPPDDTLGVCRQSYRSDPPTYYQTQDHQLDTQYRKRPNYKPSALRWPFLTMLLVSLFAVIGLLAYGLHALPVHSYNVPGLSSDQERRLLLRDDDDEEPATDTIFTSTTSPVTMTRPAGDFGTVGSVTVTGPTISTTPEPVTSTTAADDYGDASNIITITVSNKETSWSAMPSVASQDHGNIGTVSITSMGSAVSEDHGDVGTISITDTIMTPTYVPAITTTLTNSDGVATYTSTDMPSAISTPMTTVLTNSLGLPTTTAVTNVLATPVVSTLTDAEGVATATETYYPVMPSDTTVHIRVYYISYGEYVIGFFLPTILSILIAIPIRVLDINAKLFQPWHELTHAHGATGWESLCLETSGWRSIITSVRSLFGGQALVFLTTTLVICSSILVPLSAVAVGLNVQGGCLAGESARNCAYELSVFDQSAKATLGLLGFMIITVMLLICFLAKWKSGVSTNPWSICGIASLSQNKDVRGLFTSGLPAGADAGEMPKNLLRDTLGERRFRLGWFRDDKGGMEYGIMLYDEYPGDHPLHTPLLEAPVSEKSRIAHADSQTRHDLPFLMLGYFGRLLFLSILLGLLALILYYNNTGGDTAFERFMDGESFGVKFLFTGVGVIITFFWSSFFSSIATMSPYHLLAARPQLARQSIILSPPTNALSGIMSGFRRHHAFLALVGLTAILSEFLTIFLSNIPYRVTQTFLVARICTWSAVGILAIMVLVVIGSFFAKWPHMPIDPSTIAGAMYYVCDSWMLKGLDHMSASDGKERNQRVESLNERYEFGEMTGQNGTVRIGVDSVNGRVGV